ncbi:hypothetical protein [Deinococcus budaensis]|uniref:Uncharacterized protein n=1 Tax=Deinococcus budaensis TaxID=1665626 RepID=A0A7W8LS20_9DEIO|nr:hypothetical protein [Deinococcus budaensis]MBB5236182.1 hypothetical protein [Deinococcus budaensis]
MTRLLLLAALLLTPAALACPVKPGTVANGLFKDTRRLPPICGPLYLTFKQAMSGTKWTEMYALDSQASKTRTAQTNAILASIVRSGYRKVREQKGPRSQVYLFQRRKNTITAVVGISGPVHYLALAGQ